MITILGAGFAGLACLSCSYHLGQENCILFDCDANAGGHSYSHQRDGFVWDEGPHVSFSKHPYVRDLLEESVQGGRSTKPFSSICLLLERQAISRA